MSPKTVAARVLIKGRVQGVGYRYFVQEVAGAQGLQGWVRNVPDGSVETVVEGAPLAIERWLEELRKGPPMSRVETIDVNWIPLTGQFTGFEIR